MSSLTYEIGDMEGQVGVGRQWFVVDILAYKAACLVALSTLSFPGMPTCTGTQRKNNGDRGKMKSGKQNLDMFD